MRRREFLHWSGAAALRAVVGSSLWALGCDPNQGAFGQLGMPDENGIRLSPGFRSRVLAVTGEKVAGTDYRWHGAPDGGAVFPQRQGYIYVSNAEISRNGGVSALRFDPAGRIVDAYAICSGTRRNCAGGATPWGTWLSCEEVDDGLVYECDPTGQTQAVARPALGRFKHEAVAVDPKERRLYLTEDTGDGRLYRFTPNSWTRLDQGLLEVMEVYDGTRVRWHQVPNPAGTPVPTRRQVPESTRFRGGEGIVWDRGQVYFTTKGDDRVWHLDVAAQTVRVIYERSLDPRLPLSGVDNIVATPSGEVIVAEDGGNMELVMLTESGRALPVLRVIGQAASELAGPAFDPTGRRLFFSSQRGRDGRGITYEVRGPFRPRA